LTSLIFESFVTPPRYSSQGFLLTSPQNSGHENLAACTLQEVAIGVGLEEEERGEDASPLSESHYIPSHSMESSQEDDKPGSAAENLSTALPLIKDIGNILSLHALFMESASNEPPMWRPPFPADTYALLLASQKRLLKHLIVLNKVIITAKVEGTGIYDLLSPPLLSSMHQIQVEVLGCLEELLKQLTSNSSKRVLDETIDMEDMESGRVKTQKRIFPFAPLRASISLQLCERELTDVLIQTIEQYFSSSQAVEQNLPISNMDVISFFTFLFLVRGFVAEVSVLWRGVQRLLQVEALYSKHISSRCNWLERRLLRL